MTHRAVTVLRTHDDRLVPVAGTYEIDTTHTAVEFVAKHLRISKVRGRFKDVSGRITIAEEPEDSHVEVRIGAASLDTGNTERDAHLRSADFFDVERYPTITFQSTAVQALPGASWEVTGDLTLLDKTRAVRLVVDFEGAEVSPNRDERIGFSAETEVRREDFGLVWNEVLETGGVLIGHTVRIELTVQAVALASAAVA